MQIEPSKARILADCIEEMAADAEDKGKDAFGIHLSLEDARMITRSLRAASFTTTLDGYSQRHFCTIRESELAKQLSEPVHLNQEERWLKTV